MVFKFQPSFLFKPLGRLLEVFFEPIFTASLNRELESMQKYQFPFHGDYANPFDEHSVTLVLHKHRTGNLRKKKKRDLIVLPVQNMLLRLQKHPHFTWTRPRQDL